MVRENSHWARRRSPVDAALDAGDGLGAGVGHGALDAGDGRVPRVVQLAVVELDLDDLAALVVGVRADDEPLFAAVHAVADCDDVPGLQRRKIKERER